MTAVKIQHKNCLQSTLRKKIINTLFANDYTRPLAVFGRYRWPHPFSSMCRPEPHWLSKQGAFCSCAWNIWITKAMFVNRYLPSYAILHNGINDTWFLFFHRAKIHFLTPTCTRTREKLLSTQRLLVETLLKCLNPSLRMPILTFLLVSIIQ